MLWTSIGRAPGLFLYVYLGTLGQLGLNLARGRSHPRLVEYWTWGGAFLITVLLFILLTRIALHPNATAISATLQRPIPVSMSGVMFDATAR